MLSACTSCSTRYAAGVAACPHCGATQYQEAPGGAVEDGAPILTSPAAAAEQAAPEPAAKTKKAKAAAADESAPTQEGE